MIENNRKKFLNVVKKSLPLIKKHRFPIWQQEMEQELTYNFLFTNVYFMKNISKKELPKFKLVNQNALHDINGYETIEDFMETLTGEDFWNEYYGFKTYYISMKDEWYNNLLREIEVHLKENNLEEEYSLFIEDEKMKEMLLNIGDEFWDNWTENNFKEMIAKHLEVVWEDNNIVSMENDMLSQETERRFKLFEPIVLDLLEYLKQDQIDPLNNKNKDLLIKVQKWAKTKNYEELSLFDEFYPKTNKLKNFKWLEHSIYQEKMDEKKELRSAIESLFTSKGIQTTKEIPINKSIQKLYHLRNDIFAIEGEKIIDLQNSEGNYMFYIDSYNRVDGNEDGIGEFTNILEKTLQELGSLVVRQMTGKTYIKKVKNRNLQVPYFNLYGAMLFQGTYKGLPAEEMHEIYTLDPKTGNYKEEKEGIFFMNWKIGDDF